MTQFGAWLRQQADRDDPVGDLARDYTSVKLPPRTVDGVLTHMRDHGACDAAIWAYEEAVDEWMGVCGSCGGQGKIWLPCQACGGKGPKGCICSGMGRVLVTCPTCRGSGQR